MDLGIEGRTALVLGAGGGLGSAISAALAHEGANVALADVNENALASTVAATRAHGVTPLALVWDIADLATVEANVRAIEKDLGEVEILINVTGGPPPTPVAGVDPDSWRRHFESMVLSVIVITDRVLPGMKRLKWGRIITSTSSGAISPIPNLGISNTLRTCLHAWSKTLAGEVASDGITVNVVIPGRINTSRVRALDEAKADREGRAADDVAQASTSSIPVGRYGDPGEYGGAVAFLASAQASYITGSTVRVDGGLIACI